MYKKYLGYAVGAMLALTMAAPVLAATSGALSGDDFFGGDTPGGLTPDEFAESAGLSSGDLPKTIASIIRTALGFLGIVAVVIILAGGFQWMTAGGTEEKVKTAKRLIIQGIIGLVIILSAFAIATFVIGSITSAVNSA